MILTVAVTRCNLHSWKNAGSRAAGFSYFLPLCGSYLLTHQRGFNLLLANKRFCDISNPSAIVWFWHFGDACRDDHVCSPPGQWLGLPSLRPASSRLLKAHSIITHAALPSTPDDDQCFAMMWHLQLGWYLLSDSIHLNKATNSFWLGKLLMRNVEHTFSQLWLRLIFISPLTSFLFILSLMPSVSRPADRIRSTSCFLPAAQTSAHSSQTSTSTFTSVTLHTYVSSSVT